MPYHFLGIMFERFLEKGKNKDNQKNYKQLKKCSKRQTKALKNKTTKSFKKLRKRRRKRKKNALKKHPSGLRKGHPPDMFECDCLASVSFISLFLAPTTLVQWLEEAGLEETCDASLQLGDRKPWFFFVAFEGFEGPQI